MLANSEVIDPQAHERIQRVSEQAVWREKALQVPVTDSVLSSIVAAAERGSLIGLKKIFDSHRPMLDHPDNPPFVAEFVEATLSLMDRWESVEASYGRGAVLNLADPFVRRMATGDRMVRFVGALDIANAERFKASRDHAAIVQLPESFRKFRERYPSR